MSAMASERKYKLICPRPQRQMRPAVRASDDVVTGNYVLN